MLSDRFSRTDKPFHSTGYAEVARGAAMGSTNAQSFGERYRIERNRRHIQRYGSSHLANAPQQRPDEAPFDRRQRPASSASRPINIPPRAHFSEPPTRHYNPFG